MGWLSDLDLSVADWLNELALGNPWLVKIMKVITFFGSSVWLWPLVGAAVIYMLVERRVRPAIFVGLTSLVGLMLNKAMKVYFNRPRPVFAEPVASAPGFSFPSGHAMNGLVCYGALLIVLIALFPRKKWPISIVAGVVILLVGLSRLLLGVHFLTDVLGGWALGAVWLAGSAIVIQPWRRSDQGT